jgi:hypothetical protein
MTLEESWKDFTRAMETRQGNDKLTHDSGAKAIFTAGYIAGVWSCNEMIKNLGQSAKQEAIDEFLRDHPGEKLDVQ